MSNWFTRTFLNEKIDKFKNKGTNLTVTKSLENEQGEGYESMGIDASTSGLNSFNTFYDNILNKQQSSNNINRA